MKPETNIQVHGTQKKMCRTRRCRVDPDKGIATSDKDVTVRNKGIADSSKKLLVARALLLAATVHPGQSEGRSSDFCHTANPVTRSKTTHELLQMARTLAVASIGRNRPLQPIEVLLTEGAPSQQYGDKGQAQSSAFQHAE
ncbi:unnamed protein product [Durusdinium trenchii]|uniref:Uncharacterized protein n=1 Tax=Durusdinium trenchii TaxID=1381693 RepID=A0ABP0NH85_9DINO